MLTNQENNRMASSSSIVSPAFCLFSAKNLRLSESDLTIALVKKQDNLNLFEVVSTK